MLAIRRMAAGTVALLAVSLPIGPLQAATEQAPPAHVSRATAGVVAVCQRTAKGLEVARVRADATGLEVKHGKARTWKKAKASMTLVAGDWLRTKEKSRTEVDLCDGGTLALNTSSTAHLTSLHAQEARRGEMAVFLKKGTNHEVKAPAAQVTAKGTHFDITVERGRSIFVVVEGSMRVKNKKGSVVVKRNQKTVVATDKAPQRPVQVDAQKTISWAAPLAWQVLTAPDLLSVPRRVALDAQGNIYVTDAYHNRVLKLSPTGHLLTAWGNPGAGPGDFNTPYPEPFGIALDAAGNIYFTDAQSTITKLSPEGAVLATLGGSPTSQYPDALSGPTGLTIDAQGTIYVVDTVHSRIVKMSPAGDILAEYGTEGSGPGQFEVPEGVAVDPAGNIYVADMLNHRIQKLSATGQPLAQWGSRGTQLGQFDHPTDLTLDTAGNIYVADSGNNRVVELSPSGKTLTTWGTSGGNPGEFVSLEGVALDPQGNIYAVDRANNRIQKYTRPG